MFTTRLVAYLGSLEDAEMTGIVLHEYRTARNMTDQFAALVALDQKPGKIRDEALADFYDKWQHDSLVCNTSSYTNVVSVKIERERDLRLAIDLAFIYIVLERKS